MLCVGCGLEFVTKSSQQKYCTVDCRKKHTYIEPKNADLSTGTTGAISELIVSADLLSKNIPVFRALSPSCPFDLVAAFHGRFVSIEVRTASRAIGKDCLYHEDSHQGADLFGLYVHGESNCHYCPISNAGKVFCLTYSLSTPRCSFINRIQKGRTMLSAAWETSHLPTNGPN